MKIVLPRIFAILLTGQTVTVRLGHWSEKPDHDPNEIVNFSSAAEADAVRRLSRQEKVPENVVEAYLEICRNLSREIRRENYGLFQKPSMNFSEPLGSIVLTVVPEESLRGIVEALISDRVVFNPHNPPDTPHTVEGGRTCEVAT